MSMTFTKITINKANQAANLYTKHLFSAASISMSIQSWLLSKGHPKEPRMTIDCTISWYYTLFVVLHHFMVLHLFVVLHHSCRSCTIIAGAAPFHGTAPVHGTAPFHGTASLSWNCTFFFGLHVEPSSSIIETSNPCANSCEANEQL